MNTTVSPAVLEPTSLCFSSTTGVESVAQWAPRGRRLQRSWKQKAGVWALVAVLQVGIAVAFVRGGMVSTPLIAHPLMMVNVNEVVPERPDVEPPPPPQVVPIIPEVPVVFDVVSETAITLPKPKDNVERTQPSANGSSESQAIVARYQTSLLRHLAAYKRYPMSARRLRQEGVVMVRFTMDRNGRVLNASLASASTFEPLDEEAVSILRRATPLPAPPIEVKGDPVTMVVPIQFSLH